ncbi:hypothetical protein BH10PSE12_BH10PSE12_35120 [soil metagenome]
MLSFSTRSIAGTVAAFATAMTLLAVTPARAETVSIPVSYHGLDLSSQNDAAVMTRRIVRAAAKVCSSNAQLDRLQVAKCRRVAIASAQTELQRIASASPRIVLAAR